MSAQKRSKSKRGTRQIVGEQRLQRIMAAAGVGSRRECEIIIQEGRVEVDGEIVATLGVKVDPSKQEIYVDAEKIVPQILQYFILNKPPGIVSTSNDPSGRIRVIDLIKTNNRVYNVGRLDRSSEGLILVTNDGELANRLTHPRYGISKTYHVTVAGAPTPEALKKLKSGIYLAEGKAKAVDVRFIKRVKASSMLEIVLAEGRNREIRRMLAAIGHKVRTLKRVAIGPLRLGDLPVGAHRPLTVYELKALKNASAGGAKKKRPAKKGSRKRVLKKASDKSTGKGTKKKATGRKSTGKPAKKKATKKKRPASGSRRVDRTTKKAKKRTPSKKAGKKPSGRKTAGKSRATSKKKSPGTRGSGKRR